jgi:hypothetical protein
MSSVKYTHIWMALLYELVSFSLLTILDFSNLFSRNLLQVIERLLYHI